MSVKNKTNKHYKRSQKGRSMVEMLGVLAIVGVLSVGGVYGYGVAMKKHKANELLHQASMLATTISAQIQSKGELPQSIENFGNNKYGTFSTPEKVNDEQFEMKITGMDEAVCTQVAKMSGGMVRQAECNGTTLTLTYNNNLSSDKVAADYNGKQDECEDSGRKYCSGSKSCVALDKECVCSGTNNGCQKCDTETGAFITDDEKEGENCTTADGKEGTCSDGVCEEAPTCSSTVGDPCTDNATVCPGYYCSIAGGTSTQDSVSGEQWCGDAVYTPGAGTVESLGTPREPKTGYLSSPGSVASWDAAVNYCKALKSTIAQGVTVNGVNYGDYGSLSNGLASLPSSCSMDNSCSALPDDDYYWLDRLVQWDCNWEKYDTTYGSNSSSAFFVFYGFVYGDNRSGGDYGGYALCE